jgi:DNA primase
MYTSESIDAIRSLDIVDVIGRFVTLDKHNKACCPIHNEKTPSFSVSKVKQIFKCYGCGAGGDLITFVKKFKKCDFVEAIEIIADLEQIILVQEGNFDLESYQKAKAERKGLREILNSVHDQYRKQLLQPEYKSALDYWIKRGYSEEVISIWGLGYAPYLMGFITRSLTLEGYLPQAIKLGLVKEKEDKLHQDVYINRVIIPILDEYGELVTFAGRIIEDNKKYAKYINGSVSPLYNKSKTLFGLYQAIPSITKLGYAILTEGYTDVISMHTAGATNTVAACGTSLTDDMVRLLKRYTTHVVVMRDADSAGENAEDKDIAKLLQFGFKVEIFPLDDGKDPDDFAKEFIIEFNEEDFLNLEDNTGTGDLDSPMNGSESHLDSLTEKDAFFIDSAKLAIEKEMMSTSLLQRKFNLGYNRASRIIDQLESAGIVGPEAGLKPRSVLVKSESDLSHLFQKI